MARKKNRVSDELVAAADKRLAEVRRQVLIPAHYDRIMAGLATLVQPHGQAKINDNAGERAAWFQQWYHRLGFTTVVVPTPPVSNKEIERRAALPIPQKVFYRPPTQLVSYETHMRAVGQGNHCTLINEVERAKIGWAPAVTGDGQWFWFDVSPDCPRLRTSRNDLMRQHAGPAFLAYLEQDAVAWHAERAETGVMLDRNTWTWLRNSYDASGALSAYECFGALFVSGRVASNIVIPFTSGGGRVAEVLAAVA